MLSLDSMMASRSSYMGMDSDTVGPLTASKPKKEGGRYRFQALAPKQYDAKSKLAGIAAWILPSVDAGAPPPSDIFKTHVSDGEETPPPPPGPTVSKSSKPHQGRYRFQTGSRQTGAASGMDAAKQAGFRPAQSFTIDPRAKQEESFKLNYYAGISVFDVADARYGVATFEADAGENRPPLEVCFWVDVSGSMRSVTGTFKKMGSEMESKELAETRISMTHDSIDNALNLLGPNDRVSIVTFNHEASFVFGHKFATEENKQKIRQIMKVDPRLQPDGCTDIPKGYELSRKVLDFALSENRKLGITACGFSLGLTDGANSPNGQTVVPITEHQIKSIIKQHLPVESTLIGISAGHDKTQCKLFADTHEGTGQYLDSTDMRKLKGVMQQSCEKVQNVVFQGKSVKLDSDDKAKITEIWQPLGFSPFPDLQKGGQIVEMPSKLANRKMFKILFQLDKKSDESAKIAASFSGKDLLSGKDVEVPVSSTIEEARKKVSEEDHLLVEFFHYQNVLQALEKVGDKEARRKMINEAVDQVSIENQGIISSLIDIRQQNAEMSQSDFSSYIAGKLKEPYECTWTPSEKKCHAIAKGLEESDMLFRINRTEVKDKIKEKALFFRFSAGAGEGFLVSCRADSKGKDGYNEETVRVLNADGAILVDDANSTRNTKVYASLEEYIKELSAS